MGLRVVENLELQNISSDYGEISIKIINDINKIYLVNLPKRYVNFIIKHNGAYLKADVFDYDDPNIKSGRKNSDGITFIRAEEISKRVENIKSGEEPDWDIKYRFEDGLIPFGDNGGGDLICFDYRKNRDTDNPPVVIWNHDMGFDHRVVFIANSFEEFIDMLHEPNDDIQS
jgi:hypothetical protein